MTRKRPDYTEARNYYIKGERNEYPTLQDIATEFNYSLSTLRKQAANEGWLTKRKERIDLKETIHKINNFDLAIIQADTQNVQDLRNMVDQSKKDHTKTCFETSFQKYC